MPSQKFSATGQQARIDFTYNNRNELTNIKRYDDTAGTTLRSETVYAYDDAGRVTSITHKNGSGTTVDSYSYSYDDAGRVTQVTSTLAPTQNYTYDDSSQLLGDGTNTFSYDANGNRTMTGYTISAGNRVTSDGTYSYTWDDEGNLATKSKTGEYWVYAWDVGNHLTDVKEYNSQGGTLLKEVKYVYDVFSNEIEKDLDADGNGTFESVSKYAYDHNQNGFLDLDSSGSLITRRIDGPAVDALFARIGASNNEDWFLGDVQGSTRDIVNSSGTLIDRLEYNGFGEVSTETSASNGDEHGYTSKRRDPDIGFQNNTNRWYITHLGTWASQDPEGFGAGDPNLSRYVRNNATNATDPSGLYRMDGGLTPPADVAASWGFGQPTDDYDVYRQSFLLRRSWTVARAREIATAMYGADMGEQAAAQAYQSSYVPPPGPFNIFKFGRGLVAGVGAGAWQFVEGLGSLITNPMGALQGITQLVSLVASGDFKEAAKAMFPELYTLATEWNTLESYDKGYLTGKVIGQYGAQALTGALATRLTQFVKGRLGGQTAGRTRAPT